MPQKKQHIPRTLTNCGSGTQLNCHSTRPCMFTEIIFRSELSGGYQ